MGDAMAHATRMSDNDTGLLVIDLQEKLLPLIPDRDRLVRDVVFLLDAASILGMTVVATEQYPKGLGPTVSPLIERLPHRPAKTVFSACATSSVVETLHREARPKVVLCGIEAHVCVLQTALDLLAHDFRVYVAADAVASRYVSDCEIALRRLEREGVILTTVEMCVFEWIAGATHPRFKDISRLVQERMKAISESGS
ncbi:MAG: hydrolase [Planctomycetia bacterium]|nr:hydrolase [Planctomycetia bacterium]